MAIETDSRIVVLKRGTPKAKVIQWRRVSMPRPIFQFCGTGDEVEAAVEANEGSCWVSFDKRLTTRFLKAAASRPNFKIARFLQMRLTSLATISSLQSFVRDGIISVDMCLPPDELFELLKVPESDRRNVFLGGSVDPETQTVALVRGNLEWVTVPFSFFRPSGDGVEPDFGRLAFTDYGRTVCFGDYEAAADAILYELNPEFRRRLNQQRQAEEKTFGACLRRLRKQRGLKRSDFPGIDEKTVARLERNESAKPHGKTMQILADCLGVAPNEIESF